MIGVNACVKALDTHVPSGGRTCAPSEFEEMFAHLSKQTDRQKCTSYSNSLTYAHTHPPHHIQHKERMTSKYVLALNLRFSVLSSRCPTRHLGAGASYGMHLHSGGMQVALFLVLCPMSAHVSVVPCCVRPVELQRAIFFCRTC